MKNYLQTLVFIIAAASCIGQVHREKAIVTPEYIDTAIKLEKPFSLHSSPPAPNGIKWFQYKPGSNHKVLIIARHATAQTREGNIKQADAGTGSIALVLHIYRNVPVLYTTYLSPWDPNYYDNNEFKDSLSGLIGIIEPFIVIDLHGSNPLRPYDVDFGTMHQTSLMNKKRWLDTLSSELFTNGLVNQSLDFFAASSNQTVTKFVRAKGYPCVQLEINSNYLSPGNGDINAQKTAQLLQALIRFIDDLQ